jgi:hypothetical protein
MKTTFTMLQADAYAESHTRAWEFIWELRAALGIPKGIAFDWADALDILNGHGYFPNSNNHVSSKELILGDFSRPDKVSDDLTWWPGCVIGSFRVKAFHGLHSGKIFDASTVRQALQVLQCRHWMLTYAKGSESVARDLKSAYAHRSQLIFMLDNFEW